MFSGIKQLVRTFCYSVIGQIHRLPIYRNYRDLLYTYIRLPIYRNYRDLHIPNLNLELTKKGFHYSSIKAWNDIPVNIRELPSLRLFKTHLNRHLMSFGN